MKNILACLAISLGCASAQAADVAVYSDSLAPGWQDWSWGSTRNLANTSPAHAGPNSIAVTITQAWAALYLRSGSPTSVTVNDQLSFWIHGGGATHSINVVANGSGGQVITVPANAWTHFTIPFSALGVGPLSDLYWQDATGAPQPTFYVDDVSLVIGAPPAAQPGPNIVIDVASGRHPIDDDIYGMNFVDEALAAELRMPVRRFGGNSTSRYNWQIDVHNTASDYFYENIPDGNSATLPNGSSTDLFVEQDRRTGTRSLITMPLIGWTPKRRLNNHPYDCGFRVTKYGAQDATDPFDTGCGNGFLPRASQNDPLIPVPMLGDPTDTSVAIGPSFVTDWITHFKGRYGAASAGGVAYYNLDNEPGLWNSTHRDVHPVGISFDELRDRTYQYAAAIKAADPGAKTLGPAEWGWCSYFYSAKDPGGCGPGPDRNSHGDIPTVVYYLQQMKAYEVANGVRILDYLDLHFYPQANNVALQPAGSASTQAVRLRSTRSLWDPTYTDESYITDLSTPHELRMIPRMKEWIAANYPGTKTAMTEYNWGAPEHINGALAQAEVLGIFGREGLDLATLWDPPTSSQPMAHAFRVYRNYDGAGHGFGETSIQATSATPSDLSVFAAQRTADGAITAVVINKTGTDLTSNVTLSGASLQSTAAVYRYSGAALGAIQHLANQALVSNAFSATFPANSITLYVVPVAAVVDPTGDADNDGIPNGVEPLEGRNPNAKDNDVFGNARLFAMQQYRDFLGREGDAGGITFYTNGINGGTIPRTQVIENFFLSPEFGGIVAPVTRLYFAFFNRIPDYPGLQFQVSAHRNGASLGVIANNFAASPEFMATYGSLNNTQYVTLLYQNVLGRAPVQAEIDFHVNRLTSGVTRGEVMTGFSESPEYQTLKFNAVYVTNMYVGMLRRSPEQAGYDYWVAYMAGGNSGQALIAGFLNAPEYHNRFLP